MSSEPDNKNSPKYDSNYFTNLDEPAEKSASVVLELIGQIYQPSSVVDIGCGTGQWLIEAQKRFNAEILGIDGPWNTERELLKGAHRTVDIEAGFTIGRRFDMAICLEVAEHLTAPAANRVIDELCASADVVLFSGAVEEQTGEHHINCKWQSAWMKDFGDRGFQCFDILRPQLWRKQEVAAWYRQNIFIAVKPGSVLANTLEKENLPRTTPVDIVHPEIYVSSMRAFIDENKEVWSDLYNMKKTAENPKTRDVANMLWNYGRRIVRGINSRKLRLTNKD